MSACRLVPDPETRTTRRAGWFTTRSLGAVREGPVPAVRSRTSRPATTAAMAVVTGTAARMPSPPTSPRTTSWATISWLTAIPNGSDSAENTSMSGSVAPT